MSRGYLFLLIILLSWINILSAQKKVDYEKLFSREEIEQRALQKYIQQNDKKLLRFHEDQQIDSRDTINANVFVQDGDLDVNGVVNGDVLVLFGDVHLGENSVVNGNVTAINGKIFQDEKSFVSGNQIETNVKNLFPAREFGADYDEDIIDEYLGHYTRHYNRNYISVKVGPEDHSDILFRYNRVQGVSLGVYSPKERKYARDSLSQFFGFLSYGFADKHVRYRAEIQRNLFASSPFFNLGIGGGVYDQITSRDNWLISPSENTLTAFFLNDDYRDYHALKGFEVFVTKPLFHGLNVFAAYRNEEYASVRKHTDWAVFKDKNRFSDNPPIDDGRSKGWYAAFTLDTRDDDDAPHQGWFARLSVEDSKKKWKSDFSFTQYILEIRRYQRLSPWERLDVRLKVASSRGEVPLQKRFRMGGISTLRGFGYRSVRDIHHQDGDRLFLANMEYNVNPRIFHSPFGLDDVRYIVFLDLGSVWSRKDVTPTDGWNKGFDYLSWKTIKSDLGIALSNASGRFRINVAKRLDTGKKAYSITLRLTKPF